MAPGLKTTRTCRSAAAPFDPSLLRPFTDKQERRRSDVAPRRGRARPTSSSWFLTGSKRATQPTTWASSAESELRRAAAGRASTARRRRSRSRRPRSDRVGPRRDASASTSCEADTLITVWVMAGQPPLERQIGALSRSVNSSHSGCRGTCEPPGRRPARRPGGRRIPRPCRACGRRRPLESRISRTVRRNVSGSPRSVPSASGGGLDVRARGAVRRARDPMAPRPQPRTLRPANGERDDETWRGPPPSVVGREQLEDTDHAPLYSNLRFAQSQNVVDVDRLHSRSRDSVDL